MGADPLSRVASWNPRYVAYAKAHGRGPRAMLTLDRMRWPGGCMCGYIVWINRKWNEFARIAWLHRLDQSEVERVFARIASMRG